MMRSPVSKIIKRDEQKYSLRFFDENKNEFYESYLKRDDLFQLVKEEDDCPISYAGSELSNIRTTASEFSSIRPMKENYYFNLEYYATLYPYLKKIKSLKEYDKFIKDHFILLHEKVKKLSLITESLDDLMMNAREVFTLWEFISSQKIKYLNLSTMRSNSRENKKELTEEEYNTVILSFRGILKIFLRQLSFKFLRENISRLESEQIFLLFASLRASKFIKMLSQTYDNDNINNILFVPKVFEMLGEYYLGAQDKTLLKYFDMSYLQQLYGEYFEAQRQVENVIGKKDIPFFVLHIQRADIHFTMSSGMCLLNQSDTALGHLGQAAVCLQDAYNALRVRLDIPYQYGQTIEANYDLPFNPIASGPSVSPSLEHKETPVPLQNETEEVVRRLQALEKECITYIICIKKVANQNVSRKIKTADLEETERQYSELLIQIQKELNAYEEKKCITKKVDISRKREKKALQPAPEKITAPVIPPSSAISPSSHPTPPQPPAQLVLQAPPRDCLPKKKPMPHPVTERIPIEEQKENDRKRRERYSKRHPFFSHSGPSAEMKRFNFPTLANAGAIIDHKACQGISADYYNQLAPRLDALLEEAQESKLPSGIESVRTIEKLQKGYSKKDLVFKLKIYSRDQEFTIYGKYIPEEQLVKFNKPDCKIYSNKCARKMSTTR